LEKGAWTLCGQQTSRSNTNVKSIPSNALFILRDQTKELKERIFTYHNGNKFGGKWLMLT
jgi:hypothetical protein